MNKKIIRSFLLTASITAGLSISAPAEAHAATYTAKSGDSLYTISRLYATTVANLMVANNLTGYGIGIGETLNVPCEKYTVQDGDTLFKISQKYNISLLDLQKANNIYSNYIYAGQVLEIPLTSTDEISDKGNSAAEVYSDEELDLLARLIMAETEGQPYEAKVAVGSVVMNRVESGLFAPSINEVINQSINGYYQFTPVENGWINRPANEECIQAAKEALSGFDATNGALFYYDDSTTNQWILSKDVSVKYGNMIYSY